VLHTMKDGKQIKLADMSDRHLLNTISMMYRRAEAGVIVQYGGVSSSDEMPFFAEDVLYGDEALAEMNFDKYKAEAARRGLSPHNAAPPLGQ